MGVTALGALAGCKQKKARTASKGVPKSVEKPAPSIGKLAGHPGWAPAKVVAGNVGAQKVSPEDWSVRFEGGAAQEASLLMPYIAVQDSRGQVYIADKEAHVVRGVDELQEIRTLVGTGYPANGQDGRVPARDCGLSSPNALWVGASGRLYILDLGNAKLRVRTPDGRVQTLLTLPQGLAGGRGLVLTPDEKTIYIAAKDRIYQFTEKEGLKVFASGFENLGHLALDDKNQLYAADRNAQRVYRVSREERGLVAGNGTALSRPGAVSAQDHGLSLPRALVWLPGHGLLIGTQGGKRVFLLNADGTLSLLLDGEKPGRMIEHPLALSISAPLQKLRGLWLAPNGDLLLSHGDLGQVLRFARR